MNPEELEKVYEHLMEIQACLLPAMEIVRWSVEALSAQERTQDLDIPLYRSDVCTAVRKALRTRLKPVVARPFSAKLHRMGMPNHYPHSWLVWLDENAKRITEHDWEELRNILEVK